jgi:hypothetical protein
MSKRTEREESAWAARVRVQQEAAELAATRHKETLAAVAAVRAEMGLALGDLAAIVRVLVAQREAPDPAAALSAGSVAEAVRPGRRRPKPVVSPLPHLTEPGMTVAEAVRPGRRRPVKGRAGDEAGERKAAPEAV